MLRVSGVETTADEIRSKADALQLSWRNLFETKPCLPLEGSSTVHSPTKDAGPRLVALSDNEIMLSVGRFGTDGFVDSWGIVTDYSKGPQGRDNCYRKTILIDVNKAASRIYTIGHRNPEGMTVAPDGTIWLTEHGPRGGDELNRIVEGRNYGWPIVSRQDGPIFAGSGNENRGFPFPRDTMKVRKK